ncbi:hypothetical protein BDV36DRAFT_260769 [Aspergillus pseudocaelatus]|uniref:Uncharacterized protein n=1 Tax=Aspergillus pseudocaelatus TaxID=1825620 RepID=A0ABQ6WGG2_9EURO|nr:hypothetical protein BDV36DRAFT_260769 [Aspergillus pseudocaelatus]
MDNVHHRRNISVEIIHIIIGYCGRAESLAEKCVCAFVNLVIFFFFPFLSFFFLSFFSPLPRLAKRGQNLVTGVLSTIGRLPSNTSPPR